MLPEPLVTVSWFSAPELAEEDLGKLQAAGLDAYLGGGYHRHHGAVELQVPESQVRRAFEVLELDPPEPEPQPPAAQLAPACPDCGSRDTAAVAPWAFRVILATLALFAVSLILGRGAIGLVFVVIGWLVSLRLSRRSGNHRCRRCQREWKPA